MTSVRMNRRYFARLVLYLAISDLWLCTSFLMGRGHSAELLHGNGLVILHGALACKDSSEGGITAIQEI